ncbi:MAG: ATP-dependent helicase HrpB [Nitrospirota bacterium]|nr:ATP-dependent helicase HrpB [Nitrospirota bacterium]
MNQRSFYPIDTVIPRLKEALQSHHSAVLHAPPGAGKTTRVPLELLNLLPPGEKIVMLEPRRIAAVSAARWMARCLGEEAGQTVGYAIRFDTKISERTRIEVVTEGVLTRRVQADPGLEGTSLVIFDEFHERSLHADLALTLCLDIRKQLRSDLKVLVMSATLETGPLAALLGDAPVISSSGRTYPVEERYLGGLQGPLAEKVSTAVRTAIRETSGDILVFLPGAGEIRACAHELKPLAADQDSGLSLHPLFGDLPFEDQERAILPSRDRRKIVLATNIAETSLTIEGVHVVIDSGLTRVLRYDPASGMNRLMTVPASRSSAEQRKGRAGRLGPGVCYRLYEKIAFQSMPEHSHPEIMTSDLSSLVLELGVWGVHDPGQLAWLTSPPEEAWSAGTGLLKALGALDDNGLVTGTGREMVRLPLHPRLARMLLRSKELGSPRLGSDLAALLTERDIFRHSGEGTAIDDPDVSERIDKLRLWRREKMAGRADPSALRSVERTAKQLLVILAAGKDSPDGDEDQDLISRLLLAAFPDRICRRREDGGRVFVHAQGRGVRFKSATGLMNSPYIIAVAADAGDKAEGYIHLAAPVSEEVIRSECGRTILTRRKVEWDRKDGRIIAAVEERIGSLLLSSRQFSATDEEAAPLLLEAVRSDAAILNFSAGTRQLQGRAAMLRKAFPEGSWPDLSDGQLRATPEQWLLPWLAGMRTVNDLRKIDLAAALRSLLSREQVRMLDELAPLQVTVPSGSRIALDYTSGDIPVLAVKLQEMFGLADTPVVARGRVKVLLHLLSPARRPVQITHDLKGFWNSAYLEVRKDLKGRYPKHPWPDDPWNAAPTKRTNRRKD